MRNKAINALILAIPVLLALFGGFFLWYELDARQTPPLLSEELIVDIVPVSTARVTIGEAPEDVSKPAEPEPSSTPEPITEQKPPQAHSEDSTVKHSTIHIRGRSYPLKWNIEEATLKKNIGWMDTSAKPGEVGVCVVMGHRNQQLRCLKDVERGDVITIVDANGGLHSYTVESGEIITDNNIIFGATDRKVLVLITCYPFYYSGSAPHQYVVTAAA